VATFLETSKGTVANLLEEGRLGGVLIEALKRRGVPVTPKLKNSVEAVVRKLGPNEAVAIAGPGGPDILSSGATITIMFTDIVGSTAMLDRLGDRRAREVVESHNRIVRRHTLAHGGVEVKSMGDGFMLTFPSARQGVGCAVALQRELEEYNSGEPESPLQVRTGLSAGEPVREERDLFGRSVVVAERISSKAEGGQVLVSDIVHGLVTGGGEFSFRALGEFSLKGISGTHRIHEVLWRRP
jgi:class 3 adenylate cyclase